MFINHWSKYSELAKVTTAYFTEKPLFESEASKFPRGHILVVKGKKSLVKK